VNAEVVEGPEGLRDLVAELWPELLHKVSLQFRRCLVGTGLSHVVVWTLGDSHRNGTHNKIPLSNKTTEPRD
jgi:hypothetical protein